MPPHLPGGVMVAHQPLELSVKVRILARQSLSVRPGTCF